MRDLISTVHTTTYEKTRHWSHVRRFASSYGTKLVLDLANLHLPVYIIMTP